MRYLYWDCESQSLFKEGRLPQGDMPCFVVPLNDYVAIPF